MSPVCPRCGASSAAARLGTCLACFLDAELPAPLVGENIELIEEIGRGGMGIVYRARHLGLDRQVAVKFLHPGAAARPDLQERLEREARALARLQHPNIVAVHDLGREGDASYIVMELVEGRPLSELLPLSIESALDVARQVAAALGCAHGAGIVHRDVKPANVLVRPDGSVKVTDFGLARLAAADADGTWRITAVHEVLGTPPYMAPEALAGAPPAPAMDVFSLGVLVQEAITGAPTALETPGRPTAFGTPGRPTGSSDALPAGLGAVLARATARDPRDRPASVEALVRELDAAQAGARGLLPDESLWLWAVALLHTLSTAVACWAFVVSMTPKALLPGDLQPLVMLGGQRLADGRVVSLARFETGPILAALAMAVLSLAAQGLLRRHWRENQLDVPAPQTPIAESHRVLWLGSLSLALYLLREQLAVLGFAHGMSYVPLLGGALETATLLLVWVAILRGWRTARPLAREKALWLGLALALTPPATDLLQYLRRWQP